MYIFQSRIVVFEAKSNINMIYINQIMLMRIKIIRAMQIYKKHMIYKVLPSPTPKYINIIIRAYIITKLEFEREIIKIEIKRKYFFTTI